MQAYQRKRHRIIWVLLTLITAVALWVALTNPERSDVRKSLDQHSNAPS